MVGRVSAYNALQNIPTFRVASRLTATSQSWYTCPAGRKAKVRGYFIVDAFGAATIIHIEINPTAGVVASGGVTVVDIQSDIVEVDLAAGDVLGYDQDAGTNGTVDGVWSIQESDA